MRLFHGKNKRGFTIVEAILTMVVISIGLFGIMLLYSNVAASSMEGDMTVIASYLAREKLELMTFTKAMSGYAAVTVGFTNENPVLGYGAFSRETTVTEVSKIDLSTAQPNSGYKRIDVTVRWGAAAGQNVQISSLFTSY